MNDPMGYLLIGAACGLVGYWLGRLRGGVELSGVSNVEEARKAVDRLSPDGRRKVLSSYEAKRKIEAIKFFREDTGCGLREARDGIELMILDDRSRVERERGRPR